MNIVPIFAVPMWEAPFPKFEETKLDLLEAVSTYKKNNPEGIKKSNFGGGYHSSHLSLIKEKSFFGLLDYFSQLALKAAFDLQFKNVTVFISGAWININDTRSCYNITHIHNDTFSGVFFLKAPEKSGKLILNNPGMNGLWKGCEVVDTKNKFNGENLKIDPIEGHIFMWPSYVPHSVDVNDHDDERISIAFNAVCVPKEARQE